ncbi:hypothetical protein HK101_004233 [Irineochytrium annulatum]|nr:hypothetical protein HK101_004233 [Irineochytrium annulatum]
MTTLSLGARSLAVLTVLASSVLAADITITNVGLKFAIDGAEMPNPLTVNVGDVITWNIGPHDVVEGTVDGNACTPASNGVFQTSMFSATSGTSANSFSYTVPASDAGLTRSFYCDLNNHCLQGMVGAIAVAAAGGDPGAGAATSAADGAMGSTMPAMLPSSTASLSMSMPSATTPPKTTSAVKSSMPVVSSTVTSWSSMVPVTTSKSGADRTSAGVTVALAALGAALLLA